VEVLTISSLGERPSARRDSATCTTVGEESPFDGLREGASRSWAERKLTRMLIIAVFQIRYSGPLASSKTAPKIITHRQVIEPDR
jgi:hypothetical protein